MNGIREFQQIVDKSKRIVFFGGAGVSTESGIHDFRSTDGLYNQKYQYPPETILSHTFYIKNTEEFYKFYRDKMICLGAKPNMAHTKLADMEKGGKLKAVVTQNIDGLHQLAGSSSVFELHGSIHRNYCQVCGKLYNVDYILNSNEIPRCDCGGVIKPDVVLYEEQLNGDTVEAAVKSIANADTLIIGGTSLAVYPASGLINYFSGNNLVVINRETTSLDNKANLVIQGNIGEVLGQIKL